MSTGVTASPPAAVRVGEVPAPFHKDPIAAAINWCVNSSNGSSSKPLLDHSSVSRKMNDNPNQAWW